MEVLISAADIQRRVCEVAKEIARDHPDTSPLLIGVLNGCVMFVADLMKAEAEEAANAALDKYSARVKEVSGILPDRVIREGDPAEEMVKLIEEDDDIGILVLAAATGKEGPGPLVSSVAKTAGAFPIPVAIVPGHLNDEALEALA